MAERGVPTTIEKMLISSTEIPGHVLLFKKDKRWDLPHALASGEDIEDKARNSLNNIGWWGDAEFILDGGYDVGINTVVVSILMVPGNLMENLFTTEAIHQAAWIPIDQVFEMQDEEFACSSVKESVASLRLIEGL